MKKITKPIIYGLMAALFLLGIYFLALTLVSGWSFAKEQFFVFWYFIVSLAIGFGIQVGLYAYLVNAVKSSHGNSGILGVTGATSTVAMISCCAHYLVNLLTVLGIVGIVSFVAQYQVELFWVGIFFNLVGILYMASKILKFSSTFQRTN